MNKKFYKEEVVMACDWFSDLYTNKRLPSHDCISKWFNEYYVESFPVRNAYVTTFGFPLLTKEVIAEITSAINSLVHVGGGIPTVLELCCGSGYLGSLLKGNGLNVICTDSNAWKNDDPVHGHGNFFQKPYTEIEEISALQQELKEVKHHCQSLGNRCFVFSRGVMCTYCGCGELCPHGLTDEEYHAIAVFMKKNHLSHTDENREKVNEFIVNRRLQTAKREFEERNKK